MFTTIDDNAPQFFAVFHDGHPVSITFTNYDEAVDCYLMFHHYREDTYVAAIH